MLASTTGTDSAYASTKTFHSEAVARIVVLLRPCATSAGFTHTPEPPRRIDMARLKTSLLAAGFQIVVDAKVILIVRMGVESSLYDNGKVLVKTTDRPAAEAAYAQLEPHLQAVWLA
jgi:hypothetical protein